MNKKCNECKEEKLIVDFAKKKTARDGVQTRCKVCTRKSIRKHYRNRKKYYLEKSTKNKSKFRVKVSKLKNKPCLDCKKKYPYYVMDFDHVRGTKKFELSNTNHAWKDILKEIKKCDLVCANCHRMRTFKIGDDNHEED